MKKREFLKTATATVGSVIIPTSFMFSKTETGRFNAVEENKSNISKGDVNALLIPENRLNANGRVYSRHVIEKAIETFKQDQKKKHTEELIGVFYPDGDLTLGFNFADAAFYVTDLYICGGQGLRGVVTYLNTEKGKTIKHAMAYNMDLVFRISGEGKIDDNGNVTEFKFWHAAAFPRKYDSWLGDEAKAHIGRV